MPRAGADAAALADAPDHRAAVDAANAADLALGRAVGEVGEHRQDFAQRGRVLARAALDQAEMIHAQHVDEPPGHGAVMGGLAAGAQLRDHRLARRRRAGDADDVERDVVEQAEIGAALADRQMLGQMPVRAERAHAELGDGACTVDRRRLRRTR